MNEQTLLLDTHAWIWYLLGSDELRDEKILKSIESATASSRLFVSSITLWETAMVVAKRRLALSIDTLDWMRTGLRETGMVLCVLHVSVTAEPLRRCQCHAHERTIFYHQSKSYVVGW